jgi:hypothetical protein
MGKLEGVIGVVIPAYREAGGIAATVRRVDEILAQTVAD